MSIEIAKEAAGKWSAQLIEDGMLVGLGTGTTAACFIQSLIERCRNGLKIKAVSSSQSSLDLAQKGGIPIIDLNTVTYLDMTVDGADQIDQQKCMIKGGGGALVREKILAYMSREMVVIVDETKVVSRLGQIKLPIEINPFGFCATVAQINRLGYQGVLRQEKDQSPFVTENHNFIYDIHLTQPMKDPHAVHQQIILIPGVVETGLFLDLAGRVVIGFINGNSIIQ